MLDFVDLTDCSLATLPTLTGLPPQVDLEGAPLHEAEESWNRLWEDHSGFEIDPEAITLGEIKHRAQAFDPLDLDVDPEVTAVSANQWESLGRRGLVLFAYWGKAAVKKRRPSEILVLDTSFGKKTRGKRWRVSVDGKEMARFSRLEEAVEAVDDEVRQGRECAASVRAHAPWRHQTVPPHLLEALAELPRGQAHTHAEALTRLAYANHGPRRPRR